MDILALKGAVELLGARGESKTEKIQSAGLDESLAKLKPDIVRNNKIIEIMNDELKAKKAEILAGGSEQTTIPYRTDEHSKGTGR